MYIYHLGCHSWIPLDVLGKVRRFYPKKQGVFAHAAALRPPSTLLIVGGYHGNVNGEFLFKLAENIEIILRNVCYLQSAILLLLGDLLAYMVPSWQAGITNDDPESACRRHRSQPECLADPECGWCSADDVRIYRRQTSTYLNVKKCAKDFITLQNLQTCYGRRIGANCTTNLQSIRCGGICPALGDCHSCLIHGPPPGRRNNTRTPLPSVSTKLGLDQCNWCVQNARCHHKDGKATETKQVIMCMLLYKHNLINLLILR